MRDKQASGTTFYFVNSVIMEGGGGGTGGSEFPASRTLYSGSHPSLSVSRLSVLFAIAKYCAMLQKFIS